MFVDHDDISQIDFSIIEAKEILPTFLDYLKINLAPVLADTIILEIKLISKAMNLPDGFIAGINYEMISSTRIKVINTWGSREKPLAKWFNYGTRDHGPVFKEALHWKDPLTGKDVFAKFVHGIERTLAMETGIELGKYRFLQKLLLEGKQYITKELDLVK